MKITRVTVKSGRYYYILDLEERHPTTGRPIQKWIKLTRVEEGEAALHDALAKFHEVQPGGDVATALKQFLKHKLPELTYGVKKEYERQYAIIGRAFTEFDCAQVQPSDILEFLNENFAGKPTARHHYKARLSTFFSWAVLHSYCGINPCREIKLKAPPKRKGKITPEVYWSIRNNLSPIGRAFIDLCFLTCQRPTEIRLLRESQIAEGMIRFHPTKTRDTTGAEVSIVITPAIQKAIDAARMLARIKPMKGGDAFVIQTAGGAPFTKSGLYSLWKRGCEKADVTGVTTRDIRPYALTTLKRMGYGIREIQEAAAHASVTTTEGYLAQYEQRVSKAMLQLPEKPKT